MGCTECLTPAFLPFGLDAEGARPVLPLACEGDLNGLVSLVLLHFLNPGVPPLFGDLVYYGEDLILMRNCGASSVYWAGHVPGPAGVSIEGAPAAQHPRGLRGAPFTTRPLPSIR